MLTPEQVREIQKDAKYFWQKMARDLAEKFNSGRLKRFECTETGPQCLPCVGFCGRACAARSIEWNPFGSRDNCAELLGRLTDEQWGRVTHELYNVWIDSNPNHANAMRLALSAPPAQIAEAVWRATC